MSDPRKADKLGGIMDLPAKTQKSILDYATKNPVGRPPATIAMKETAKEKQKLRMKLTAQSNKAIKERNWDKYINIVETMREEGVIGQKAYDNRVKNFIEIKTEVDLDEAAEDIAGEAMEEALSELRTEDADVSPVAAPRDLDDEQIQKILKKQGKLEREASITKQVLKRQASRTEKQGKRSQVAEHFTSYDKSSAPSIRTGTVKTSWSKLPPDLRNILRDKVNVDEGYLKATWERFVTAEDEDAIYAGDFDRIIDIIDAADLTAKFVPDYLDGNDEMSKEDRQILFHAKLIQGSLKDVKERRVKIETNFDKRNEMGGGISAGLATTKIQKEDYKTPEIFNNNEFILDSKVSDNAMSREMFKGINPNSLSADGEFTEEEIAQFFANLNNENNKQDNEEIGNALNNIEILSGGQNDSLFGTQDLTTTRGANQPSSRGVFQEDMPDNAEYNPAPISRGRNAQALSEIDPSVIATQERVEGATTIALGLGILSNSYRGIFGKNDIPATRQNDILTDFNQNMRLVGKRGMYGNDELGFKDNDLYEGFAFDERVKGLSGYDYSRDYHSINGIRDPYMLQRQPETTEASALNEALMFNKGTVQGSSLPQLRQQEFAYKQANRFTEHQGVPFIRGGKSTAIQIANEFEP